MPSNYDHDPDHCQDCRMLHALASALPDADATLRRIFDGAHRLLEIAHGYDGNLNDLSLAHRAGIATAADLIEQAQDEMEGPWEWAARAMS